MRKFKIFVFSILYGIGLLNANPIASNVAKIVAVNFYEQTYFSLSPALSLTFTERDDNGRPVFYVFNVAGDKGFVIVSGEDAFYPIIGVSNTGYYHIPQKNSNIFYWMNKRKNEIIAVRTNKVMATSEISLEWNTYSNSNFRNIHHSVLTSVAPLCTTTWDQSPYYNYMCPDSSLTGPVATAMAQIMKYWAYPTVGLSSSCYFDETLYGFQENYGELCASYDTSNYAWSAMPTNVTSPNQEVAKLMYDIGVSVEMDYSPTGSGAAVIANAPSAQNSYVQYFNYNPLTINGVLMASYTDSAWIDLIENELNNGRPVQYQGIDITNGGYSWVCDGFNSSNQLHMNWGWSGYDDGYFTATSLIVNSYDFTEDIGAIIGIQPGSLTAVPAFSCKQSLQIYPNPGNGLFNIELQDITGNPQMSIYNVLGQEVYTSRLTTLQSTMNLSTQSKGVYIYRVATETGKQISTGKLIIE